MASTPKRDIRMSDELWRRIGKISRDFGFGDKRGDGRSHFIRDSISDLVAEWEHSPYVALDSKHLAVVDKRGVIFYRATQKLRLNSFRQRIPCIVEQKPEKRHYYEQNKPDGISRSEWLKRQWLLNYFSIREGDPPSLLREEVDRDGVGEKTVDIEINRDEASLLEREIIISLKDYVQWAGDAPGNYDRIEVPVDFPTRNFRLNVVIDMGLFSGTAGSIPSLKLEFRNREGAKFLDRRLQDKVEYSPNDFTGSSPDDDKIFEKELRGLRAEVGSFHSRIEQLGEPGRTAPDGLPIIDPGNPEAAAYLNSFKMPQNFMFFSTTWESPHLGVVVCVQFKKPNKLPQAVLR